MGFVIRDDVLAPRGFISIEYNGPNPLSVINGLRDIIQLIFQVKGKDIQEKEFIWDITSDPRPFAIKFIVDKKFDQFTKAAMTLYMFGKQPTDPTKVGEIRIEISATLETNYPTRTIFQKFFVRPFLTIYHKMFYNQIRRNYISFLRNRIAQLEAEMRASYNIVKRVGM